MNQEMEILRLRSKKVLTLHKCSGGWIICAVFSWSTLMVLIIFLSSAVSSFFSAFAAFRIEDLKSSITYMVIFGFMMLFWVTANLIAAGISAFGAFSAHELVSFITRNRNSGPDAPTLMQTAEEARSTLLGSALIFGIGAINPLIGLILIPGNFFFLHRLLRHRKQLLPFLSRPTPPSPCSEQS